MPYVLKEFAGVTLPATGAESDISTGEAVTNLLSLGGGGAFDAYGSEQTYAGSYDLTKKVTLANDTAALIASFRQLRALVGQRGRLVRQWKDSSREWVIARLIGVSGRRGPTDINTQEVTLNFRIISPVWYGETLHTVTGSFTALSKTLSLPNAGDADVTNPVITITTPTASVETITTIIVSKTGQSYFTWAGSLAGGNTLVIDCGARSVKKNGGDAYNLVFSSQHVISDWLRLEPGANSVVVTIAPLTGLILDRVAGMWHGSRVIPTWATGSDVPQITASVSYYDGWM